MSKRVISGWGGGEVKHSQFNSHSQSSLYIFHGDSVQLSSENMRPFYSN